MQIDLGNFRKALDSLAKGLARSESNLGDELLRDGVIQRFEYSYELAWKSLKRVLEAKAVAVYAMVKRFVPVARILLQRLEIRSACLP